jgi:hypothetical protein
MRIAVKLLLAWFALSGLILGCWQELFPASFYADFPGPGHHWISPDGPYNEHLVRDVGQGNLAVGTVAFVALLTGVGWLARAVGLAAVVANVPHQVYHQANVSVLPSTTDQVLQSLTLSAVSMAAIALTVLAFRLPAEPPPTAPRTVPAPSAPTHPARS